MDYDNATNDELEALVNQKDGDAICELAERYMYGKNGCRKNLTRAYQLLHKGEKMGLQRAYIGLAQMYDNGIYFVKNEKLAKEYYDKAGCYTVPNVVEDQGGDDITVSVDPGDGIIYTPPQPPTIDSGYVNLDTMSRRIGELDEEIEKNQNNAFKRECYDMLGQMNEVQMGKLACSGNRDVDELIADTHWLLTHIAYNEGNRDEFEMHLSMDGVIARHPWAAYLAVIMHRNGSAPDTVLESDLQMLLMIIDNPNFTRSQKADAEMMIAELILHGYGRATGCNDAMAYNYYYESGCKGNDYSRNQAAQFGYNANGELVFTGQIFQWR